MSTSIKQETMSSPVDSVADPDQYTLRKTPFRLHVTPFSEILNKKYDGAGTKEDPFLVEWLPSDAENPQNWPAYYKWLLTIQVAIATLSVALASSAYSGAIESLQAQFHPSKQIILTLGVSVFVLGFAFGPLFWAPFSEVVGRRNLLIFTYAVFTMWQAVSVASPNIESLIVFRFLAGFFGSSPLVNTGGTLADMFNANQRGLAMAIFASAPFLGPALDTSTPNAPSLPPRLAVLTLVDSGQRITSAPITTPVGPALAIVAVLLFPRSASLRLRFVTQFVRRATLDHRRTRPLLVPVAPTQQLVVIV